MKVVEGDLIALAKLGAFDVIVHGCNCQCTMGAGIARLIASEFPEALQADLATNRGDASKLGGTTIARVERDNVSFYVVNAYTQLTYGRGIQIDYDAIVRAMSQVKRDFTGMRIAYPKIGAGLGGGDWDRISSIIDAVLDGEDHTLVVL